MGQQQHKIEGTHRILQRRVFSLIMSDLIEVLGDQYFYWFLIPVIGNILCVQMRLYRRI